MARRTNSTPRTIAELLTKYASNAVGAYQHLAALHRLPPSARDASVQVSQAPSRWLWCVTFEAEGAGAVTASVRGRGSHQSKTAAKQAAYLDALTAVGDLISSTIDELGLTAFTSHRHAVDAARLLPPQPMTNPSAPEGARIATAAADLQTLCSLAQAASLGLPVHLVVFDCEKYEQGQELLEISYAEISVAARTLKVTQSLIQHDKKLKNGLFCPSNPHGFAYAGERRTQTLPQALSDFQQALDHAKKRGYGCVVGHTLRSSDMTWLRALGVDFSGLAVMDLAEIEKAAVHTSEQVGLERLARYVHHVSICGPLHNAANDTVVTALVLVAQGQRYAGWDLGWVCIELERLRAEYLSRLALTPPASPAWSLGSGTSVASSNDSDSDSMSGDVAMVTRVCSSSIEYEEVQQCEK